jgi:SAM-dependent methyltransferase
MELLISDTAALVRQFCTGRVVDFGAGSGVLQDYLPKSCDYLGIERNEALVAIARQKGRNVVAGDITKTGLADQSFTVCTMFEVLEHIEDFESAISEAHRICGSHLLVTVPNIAVLPKMSDAQVVPWHILEATHVNFFTPSTLRQTLSVYFHEVEVREINPWSPGLFEKFMRRVFGILQVNSVAGWSPSLNMHLAAIAWKTRRQGG